MEITGISSPPQGRSGPVLSGGGRDGGGVRRRVAFVPALEAVLLARPSAIASCRPATPSPARTVVYNGIRPLSVSGAGCRRERLPATVDRAPFLCSETSSAGESLVAALGPGV